MGMLCALAAGSACKWNPGYAVLVWAIASSAERMTVEHLQMSAYACARWSRSSAAKDNVDMDAAGASLLRHGCARIERFQLRGLLNFFVACERLCGRRKVCDLAELVKCKLLSSQA